MQAVFRIEVPIEVQDKTDPGVSQATKKINGFDRASQRTQERLKEMNRTKYQVVLDALDRASSVIGNVSSKARSIAGRTFSFTMKVIDVATAPLRGIWNFATSIQGIVAGIMTGIASKKLIIDPISLSDSLTNANIGFETMLGSAEKAKKMISDIQNFAIKTPFNTSDVIQNTQMMMAYGFKAEDVIKDMEIIGNQAAATGRGSEGLQSIALALGQMQAHGKVAAQDMNQLTSVGVKGWDYLAQALGKSKAEVMALSEAGKISSDVAIPALLKGMQEFDGMMGKTASSTAKGLLSQIKDTFDIKILTRWGSGLQKGAISGLSKLNDWIGNNQDTIAKWGDALEEIGSKISKYVVSKVEDLKESIKKMTNSQEWKDAQTFGDKLKIAWDKIVAEPFSAWWNSTGKQYFIDKATSIGQGIGSGIRIGLLALLGIDVSESMKEGQSVGAGFLAGFKKGFDTEQITEALKTWANNNKEIVAVLGTVLGGKLIGGIYKGVKEAKSLVTDIKNIFSKGSGNTFPGATPSTYMATTMTVTASVVNVYGGDVNNAGEAARTAVNLLTSAGGAAAGTAAVTAGAAAGRALLIGGAQLALPAAAGAAGAASSLGSGYVITAPTAAAGTDIVLGTTGSMLTAGLAKAGIALGSTASTVGGAAAAGAAGSAGIIGGILGLGSAVIDLFQGIGKGKAGDTKGAKDEYVTSGTKAGMVGAGAGAGALIGSVVPGVGTAIGALVGAGIGGAGALLGGDKVGKALSDASDTGGWLSTSGKAIEDFFTKTLPKGWNSFWGGVGGFFTTTIPKWWGSLTDGVSTFFTETLPEKWTKFWEGVGDFFTDTIPYAIGYAVGKAEIFFTQDVPAFFGSLWGGIKTFFTSTLPTWASNVWNGHIVPFFTQDIPAFFSGIWSGIKTFFTSTLPTWASNTWNNNIVPFFTQDIPKFFGGLWNGISTFFTSTLPTWATNVWNNSILPFFTQNIPQFFADLWSSITGFFTETLPTIASSIWGSIKSFFTDTIPSFFSGLWGQITGSYSAGYSAAIGVQPHAYGGIMTKPHMGIVAEAGAESIIPLSPSRRTRGIDLWRETGELLGVWPYANGGIIGRIKADDGSIPVAAGNSGGGVTIKVEVSANPEFTIGTGNAGDDERILSVMKAHIRGMADDIGDELAERLARIFVNMPLKGGAVA